MKINENVFDGEHEVAIALTTCFNPNEIKAMREVSAAVVNVSGRQRMLSQRTALLALQLVCTHNPRDREKWRSALLEAIALMERSHRGLIYGDPSLQLPGHPSPTVRAMYFEPPLDINGKIYDYIIAVKALAHAEDSELTQDNPHLRYILDAATTELLEVLDAVVSQYQHESEAQQQAIARKQAELYRQSCRATAIAQAQAQELEKALSELQQAQAQLIQSEKMSTLGQLLAGVAHELNNPVSFIYGNVNHAINYVEDLLEMLQVYREEYHNPTPKIQKSREQIDLDFLIEDLPKVVSSIKIGAYRMHQLVLSLRNFSRKDEAKMKPVDIHEGIESTLLILQNRLKARGSYPEIKIIKEYGEIPLVECYGCQINQVFMNLIGNAIDALEEQGTSDMGHGNEDLYPTSYVESPTIWIRTEVQDNCVLIRIADNGEGMSEDVKACLFDPFFTTKPVGKGTGLGLSISRQIVVEKHAGQLQCVSAPGEGTEFWIELPVRQECRHQTLPV